MTKTNHATMYSRAWYGDEELTLAFPDGWAVHTLSPDEKPALSETAKYFKTCMAKSFHCLRNALTS